jgi:hypothetical protein
MDDLGAFEVGDNATSNAHDVSRRCTEVVVPRSRSSPHLIVLQQVGINEHSQLGLMTKGRHAKFGLSNPMRNTSMFLSEAIERTTI